MFPEEKLLFNTTPEWQECTTCLSIRSPSNFTITTGQIRRSAEGSPRCSFCCLLLTGLEIFGHEKDGREEMTICVNTHKKGWDIRPAGEGELGNHVEKLQFYVPGGEVYLPIAEFRVERHFVEYGDEESMGRVKILVEECNTHHECLTKTSKLPKRVIDVGNEGDMLKLYRPRDGEEGRYCVFSHCWGGVVSCVTTRENFGERVRGFGFEDLPQCFKDAVEVCRALGVRFLWIDSVCIVQGDREDWDSEGQMMSNYYANAYLTIAASRASSSNEGFLHIIERGRIKTIHCSSYENRFDCIVTDPSSNASNCEEQNPLYTRGWVFQEILLSPRVISFGAKELEWYCLKQNWCECSYLLPDGEMELHPHSRHWKYIRKEPSFPNIQDWMKIVREFTKRDLTFSSDKLPALSGLATRWNERTVMAFRLPYLAGIWKTNPFMWENLMWTAGENSTELPKPGAPSWSWASIDGCISYDIALKGYYDVSLLSAETQLRGINPYGEVTGGFLRVRGSLLKIQLDIMAKAMCSAKTSYNWSVLSRSTSDSVPSEIEKLIRQKSRPKHIRFFPDTELELAPPRSGSERTFQRSSGSRERESKTEFTSGVVYCLRFLTRPEPPRTRPIYLLMLRCADKDTQTYERIGLVSLEMVEENRFFFLEMATQEFTIV